MCGSKWNPRRILPDSFGLKLTYVNLKLDFLIKNVAYKRIIKVNS